MPLDAEGWHVFPDGARTMLEVDFGSGWINVTQWWTGLRRQSGRAGPLDRFTASTLTFALDNRDRRWSPWRDGPHGRPQRGMPARWRAATPGGLVAQRFTGWVARWEELATLGSWGVAGSRVEVTAVDGMRRLARANGIATTPAGAGEATAARLARILDAAEWSATLRALDPGVVTFAATDLSSPALDELLDTALSDGGVLFISGDGTVTFYDRDTVTGSTTPLAYFGTVVPTGGRAFAATDDAIVNVVRVARAGGTVYTAIDSASVDVDGPRLWSNTSLPLETDAQAEALAAVLLSRAISSTFLPGPIEVRPLTGGTAAWDAVIRLGVADPIAVVHVDQDVGEGFTAITRVDGIVDDVQPGRWVTTYTHSPLDEPGTYTVVGPVTAMAATVTGSTITWTWNIPVHGYDRLWIKLDGGDWLEVGNATETFTASGLAPSSTHTLCVRGRLDIIDSAEACLSATTLSVPGPPDTDPPPGSGGEPGDTEVPPVPDDCGDPSYWEWTLYELDPVAGVVELDSGTRPGTLPEWWTPTYTFEAGVWYRLCWQLVCDGAPEGAPECHDWQEPADWEDPCVFPDLPTPEPLFDIELCAPSRELRDIVSGSLIFQGPLFVGPTPGPLGADVAVQAGAGDDPNRIGSAYLGDIDLAVSFLNMKRTVGVWVNFDDLPSEGFYVMKWGTVGQDQPAWSILAQASGAAVKISLYVAAHPIGEYTIDFDAVGTTDTIGIGSWYSVVIAWGDNGVDDPFAKLYLQGELVSTVALPPLWQVKAHDALLDWWSAPDSKSAHLIGWDVILTDEEIADIFTPAPTATYDETVIADGPVAYWPLDAILDGPAGSVYDARVVMASPAGYWPMDSKQPYVYASYDVLIISDGPAAYWPLNVIDTV